MVLAKGASKLADVLVDTNGAKNVRIQASDMFNKYTHMVDTYHYAEDSVRGNIEDFTSLRSDIASTYRDYAMKLIDIYGDSIKMVSPNLFDFNRVEWLDVDDMLKYVELEYNKLTEKCAAFIGEIQDSFRGLLQNSMKAYPLTLAVIYNVLKDILLGAIPFFIGDIIDFFHRSHLENLRLITSYINDDKEIIKTVNQKAFKTALLIALLCWLIYLVISWAISLGHWIGSLL